MRFLGSNATEMRWLPVLRCKPCSVDQFLSNPMHERRLTLKVGGLSQSHIYRLRNHYALGHTMYPFASYLNVVLAKYIMYAYAL